MNTELIVNCQTVSIGEIAASPKPAPQPETPQPLDHVGALATLLAVTEVVSVEDAANAVGLTSDDLVAEALGWAAAVQS